SVTRRACTPRRGAAKSPAGPASTTRTKRPSTPSWCSTRCNIRPKTTRGRSWHTCSTHVLSEGTSVRDVLEVGANRVLGPLGYELRDKVLSERPEGFPGYLAAAGQCGMDVNDYEEQHLGWRLPRPTLDDVLFPYLRDDS